MTKSSPYLDVKTHSALPIMLRAGLIAGTLDITAASIQYLLSGGKSVVTLLQFVASGFFGSDAFTGGLAMAGWGLLLHYGIALSFAALFVLIYQKLPRLRIDPILMGVLYGVFVWIVMNLVVVPMSQAATRPFTLSRVAISMGILIVAIGLPISLLVNRYFSNKPLAAHSR
ncbi:hypothetical protein GCM10027341_35630 [Spirosoma knui]